MLKWMFGRWFARDIAAQRCWNNGLDSRVPQVELFGAMERHMLSGGGGKTPKLLFIGYDGGLASAAGRQAMRPGSAIAALAKQGGLWLGQTGGAAAGGQETDTAPGWTSLFTGVWADEHKVFHNGDSLTPGVSTIMRRVVEAGRRASFSFSWEDHMTKSYRHEAELLPGVYRYCDDDRETAASMLRAIEAGEDAVVGSSEYTDHAGHASGYSMRSAPYKKAIAKADADAARLIAAAQAREEPHGEDWLIVITSDHGGIGKKHGGPSMMESTTFFAANKAVF